MISVTDLTPLERICAVRLAAKTISKLGIPKKNWLDNDFFDKFAREWHVKRTLGTKENIIHFIEEFNNFYYDKIITLPSSELSANLISDFLSKTNIKDKNGVKKYPVSAASKIFHFYNPENSFVYDSYLETALSFKRKGNDLSFFFEKFKDAFENNRVVIRSSIDEYRKLNGEECDVGKEDNILEIRSFDVMAMKLGGRDM